MQDNVIIRQAGMDEIDRVMLFLKENWGADHVMANSKELVCYEHAWNGEFTFVLAEDEGTKKIYGVCGYIPYSNESPRDMGGGIWKVIQNPHFLLGTDMLKYIQDNKDCRMFADCGANPETKGHRKLAGHVNFKLDQYYRLNSTINTFSIAVIKNKRISPKICKSSYKMIELENMGQFKQCFDIRNYKEIMPYRDNEYIEHRYYKHIKYHYRVMGIDNGGKIDAVVIGREVVVGERKAFRIIDFLGNEEAFAGTFDAWETFLTSGGYEYVDFYEYGLDPKHLNCAGFIFRDDKDTNIIPNYFEPFEQKNVEIYISSNIHEGFRMFKGDGDQDRPNAI